MKISKKEARAFENVLARKNAESAAVLAVLHRGSDTARIERRLWDDLRWKYKLERGKNYAISDRRFIVEDKAPT